MKIFAPNEFGNLYKEAAAYLALKPLQGQTIPYCFGVWKLQGSDRFALLLGFLHEAITLSDWLSEHPNLPERKAMFELLLQTLQMCHRNNIAHGDISGEDVMVDRGNVVLVDFEFAG